MVDKKALWVVAAGLWLAALASIADGSAGAGATSRNLAQEEANKKIAVEFFRQGITLEQRLALIHPDYVQHDPIFKRFNEVNHLEGKTGFAAMINVLRAASRGASANPAPAPAGNDPVYRVLADGDLVTVMQKRLLPDPQHPGTTYESFYYETWRIKDGKLYEHWDPATLPERLPDYLQVAQPAP